MIKRVLTMLFFICLFALPSSLYADLGTKLMCDSRSIGNNVLNGNFQRALDISLSCEENDLKNPENVFAEQYLKSAYLVSAQILTVMGKYSMASERLEKAKKLSDNAAIQLESLLNTTEGYLLERTGNTERAINLYRRIAKPDELVRLGAIYLAQGNVKKAKLFIAECLKKSPSNAAAHAILGEILEGTDKAAALQEYELALELVNQQAPTVVVLNYLEVARAKRGIERLRNQ